MGSKENMRSLLESHDTYKNPLIHTIRVLQVEMQFRLKETVRSTWHIYHSSTDKLLSCLRGKKRANEEAFSSKQWLRSLIDTTTIRWCKAVQGFLQNQVKEFKVFCWCTLTTDEKLLYHGLDQGGASLHILPLSAAHGWSDQPANVLNMRVWHLHL